YSYRHTLYLCNVSLINAYKTISVHPGESLEGRDRFMFNFFLIRQITIHELDAMKANVQTVRKGSEKRIRPYQHHIYLHITVASPAYRLLHLPIHRAHPAGFLLRLVRHGPWSSQPPGGFLSPQSAEDITVII